MAKIIYLSDRGKGTMNKKEIRDFAEKIRDEYCLTDCPVEPTVITERIGIKIKEEYFKSYKGDIISGGIIKDNDSISIYINIKESINRKRFTIAHELGHYFLNHLDNKGQYVDLHRSTLCNKNTEEKDADEFAACLLMPENVVVESFNVWSKLGIDKCMIIEKLASMFVVSREAMKVRLKILNLL